jgi:hypothetical protein
MPYRFGRIPVPPEVDSFQGEVGRNQRVFVLGFLLTSAWHKSQDGAVVSNSGHNRRIFRRRS